MKCFIPQTTNTGCSWVVMREYGYIGLDLKIKIECMCETTLFIHYSSISLYTGHINPIPKYL